MVRSGLSISRWVLEVPIIDQITDKLKLLQEHPFISGLITVALLLSIVLGFLVKQFNLLDALLGSIQNIRRKLSELSNTDTELDIQSARTQLLKATQIYVETRLRDVLSDEEAIALSYHESPDAVGRYRRQAVTPETPSKSTSKFLTTLSSLNPVRLLRRRDQKPVELGSRPIIDVFCRGDVAGRLLILGEPGSGKSTTLLELARDLVAVAEQDDTEPVPIIFELSNWSHHNPTIEQWLVAQLQQEFTGMSKAVAQQLVATHQILPLLDGLDELGLTRQKQCAVKINDFLPKGMPERKAVVCCRTEEFDRGGITLDGLGDAVELQDLSDKQICQYLNDVGQPGLKKILEQAPDLWALARTPLMLTLMPVALANRAVQTKTELFDAYIDERFKCYEQKHGELPYSREQTLHYLGWLATQLKVQNQTEFLIEGLQPTWFGTSTQIWGYRLLVGLLAGLLVGLLVGLLIGLLDGLLVGLLAGLIFGPIGRLLDETDPVERVEAFDLSLSRFARKNFCQELSKGLLFGLIAGLLLGLLFGLIFGLIAGLLLGLLFGLIFGLIAGLLFGLLVGLRSDIMIRTKPNQGIIASAKNSLVLSGLGIGLAGLIQLGLNATLPSILTDVDLIQWLIVSSQAVAIWAPMLGSGGLACFEHLALRIVLWRGGAIPRDYAHFLRYTSELRLTRQTGGEFRFFHDLLREHLAQSPEP
jgi:hypothetical protein